VPTGESILLIRLDGVGDAALCVPALEGLARAYPDARFGALCSPANATLFSRRVHRVHVWRAGSDISSLRDELSSCGYTKALVATEEVAGYQFAQLAGARERAGFWHRLHKPFKSLWQRMRLTAAVYRPAVTPRLPEHEVETLYRLAQALGAREPAPADAGTLRRWLNLEASDSARSVGGALGFQISAKLLTGGVGPSSLSAIIAGTTSALAEQRVVLLSASSDEALATALQEGVRRMLPGVEVVAATSLGLPQWLGIVDALGTLVTPDTGAAHVAGMLGKSVVDLFDARDFERMSAQWRPWAGSWLCHAKRTADMQSNPAAYAKLLASYVHIVRGEQAPEAAAVRPT
jgi:ADP-heptose:LPS heptosyltransferase